ncbi:MAG: sigma 54-interacting transcriptional regulator, partial [Myxococcales bacterium]|nr:sigma 54-interacting transcriptional regulator [Myxococcales bacterium]
MHLVKPPSDPFDALITRDSVMRRVVQQLRAWSKLAVHGLITGHSGVGKSLTARVLHMAGSPPHASFVECRHAEARGVANPWATLAQSGGTLVLDGIEGWSLEDQAAVVQRLEGRGSAAAPLRVLGTSRLSLSRLQLEGRLHPGLDRRWADRVVHLPPLRARPDDVAPLVETMLRRAGRSSVRLAPEAWRALTAHGWPGNVRELRQVVDATLARCTHETVEARHLVLDPLAPPALEGLADGSFDAMRQEVDAWYLRRLLHQTDGNLSEAARRSGCS